MKILLTTCILLLSALTSCDFPSERLSIAILTPVSHPSLELCQKGFIDTIESQFPGKYSFVTYNAHGNKSLLRSEVEEIASGKYSLVLSIGKTATQMTAEVFAKKHVHMPIIFTAVNDPEGLSGDHITGVREELRFEEEIAALQTYKPGLSKILLVYNPKEPGLQKDYAKIAAILQEKHIALSTVEVFQANELKAKVPSYMDGVGALLILKDNTVVSGLEVLCKLCKEKRIPLMASDLDSPDRGAAFGYGVHELDFGIEAAKKALLVLEEGRMAGSIPVTPVADFKLRINHKAALEQGVEVAL